MGQFQISSRGGINLHSTRAAFLLRRAQKREFALLRNLKIVDQRTHGGNFSAVKRTKGVKCGDAEQVANTFFRGWCCQRQIANSVNAAPDSETNSNKPLSCASDTITSDVSENTLRRHEPTPHIGCHCHRACRVSSTRYQVPRMRRRRRRKHLVKIAHPIEQQRAFMRRLYLKILRHHRRLFCIAHAVSLPRLPCLYKTTPPEERGAAQTFALDGWIIHDKTAENRQESKQSPCATKLI
ncbi:hypothetical protein GQR58_029678 [Nymphon striatum]|nr:hypothetical protein GQR58_029678 [Nymphon striatum]